MPEQDTQKAIEMIEYHLRTTIDELQKLKGDEEKSTRRNKYSALGEQAIAKRMIVDFKKRDK
jgi:acetyl-CoA carboxylase alpha subunit